jgi:hypothetical protein
MQTQEILTLSSLSEAVLDKILAHDRWKLEQQLAHEKWVVEFNAQVKTSNIKPRIITSLNLSEDDVLINELTGYGELDETHIGKLSKTPVWQASENKATDIFYEWKKTIEDIDDLPKKDIADSRIKKLLTTFLWSNSLAQRFAFWPEGKDMHYADAAKREIRQKLQSYSNSTIVRGYEAFKKFWSEINDGDNVEFNSTFIAPILDNAYEETLKKNREEKEADVLNSPLFAKVREECPHIPIDQLKKQLVAKRGDFISAILAIELKLFAQNVPDEYKDLYNKETWEKNYFKYVRKYDETWRKNYKSLYQSISKEQELWKKELTS